MACVELVYPPVIVLTRLVFRALGLRIELSGADRIPRRGPVVLASNHVSFLDFTLVGLAARPGGSGSWPGTTSSATGQPARSCAAMRHVPVDRDAPAAAYLTARRLLEQGEAVGVFPEAGISQAYDVRALMPGAVALAAATGAPLVPVAIWGPQRVATARRPDRPDPRPTGLDPVGEPSRCRPMPTWWPAPSTSG